MTPCKCRFCSAPLTTIFADLGMTPLANSFVAPEDAAEPEAFYPLQIYVCDLCKLVQARDVETPDAIFTDYAYFSGFSPSWLAHSERYAAGMIGRFGLSQASKVVEVASNDGYLLQFFQRAGIPVLGVEPAANVAAAAERCGIPTQVRFFGRAAARELAAQGHRADLIAANNVVAHVPDLNDFVAGFEILLKPDGVLTLEFPHLLRMLAENQFDTIYHEHFSYFSFLVIERVLAAHGLAVFDVERLPTHGGSLRVYAGHANAGGRQASEAVAALRSQEKAEGCDELDVYTRFAQRIAQTKFALLEFLIGARRAGKRVAAYGAPAKGNTLLNYCGVGPELIDFTVDRSPHKQGRLLPGTRIPVKAPDEILKAKPDYLLILPWNLKNEIMEQMAPLRSWGGRFVVPIPEVEILA
ncbi:class I SAM-dependent methyltransferase [Bosea minatitlanensis]|uniref:Methyltransferase domain-containing protein n=1 Tax=Bosea minatitlanensis TaxID=128782 RepID=A0ABW0F0T0_9HYPH|nr:class I SAM-dependent methyltransferase [Bosea minatitlanensis]MCT4492014.1 class I SAM-dependent methyltransferase [Bosea minatitlanensis]